MITGPDWLLIENPKTATQAMRSALSEFPVTAHRHQPFWGGSKRVRAVFVRNPFDRMVSAYLYNVHHTRRGKVPFSDWLQGAPWFDLGHDLKRTSQMIWAWGATDVMRYESLDEDWPALLQKIGLRDRPLPRVNASGDRPHYRDLIDARSRAIIEDRFAPDMFMWGYRW